MLIACLHNRGRGDHGELALSRRTDFCRKGKCDSTLLLCVHTSPRVFPARCGCKQVISLNIKFHLAHARFLVLHGCGETLKSQIKAAEKDAHAVTSSPEQVSFGMLRSLLVCNQLYSTIICQDLLMHLCSLC